jgi:hypothetical protein
MPEALQRRLNWQRFSHVALPSIGVLIALVRRSSGLDPASLWLDDQWVALALRHASLAQIYALHIPTPIGWSALAKLVVSVSPDPEWPLQIVPFAMGLLSIPLFCWVAGRVVSQPLALGLACLLVTCHPVAELYATRVKHYSLDLVIGIGLLGLSVVALQRPSARRLAGLAVVSLAASVVSFASLFTSLCCLHALTLDKLLRARVEPLQRSAARDYVLITLGFDAGVGALYAVYFAQQSSPAMKTFWQKYFLHFDSLHSVAMFFWRSVLGFAMQAVSAWLIVLLVLVGFGVCALARDAVLRPLVWAFAALIAASLLAAALQVYPMGVERTSLFAYPWFWLFAAVGGERALRRETRKPVLKRTLTLVLAAYVTAVSLFRPRVVYSDVRDRQLIETFVKLHRDGDATLTHHLGLLALAYYGDRPLRLERSVELSQQVEGWPSFRDLFVIPHVTRGQLLGEHPEIADEQLDALAGKGYRRILYISTHALDSIDDHVSARLARQGYRGVERIVAGPRARLIVFEREPAP